MKSNELVTDSYIQRQKEKKQSNIIRKQIRQKEKILTRYQAHKYYSQIPPPPFTYSNGGGDGSREQSLIYKKIETNTKTKSEHIVSMYIFILYTHTHHTLTMIGSPTSDPSIALLTRTKFWSKRLCKPIMSLTPASLHALIASTVSERSVAIGFSQNTCFPFAAQALICSAWKDDGEQIHTASTSGSVMTSIASLENLETPYCEAAVEYG